MTEEVQVSNAPVSVTDEQLINVKQQLLNRFQSLYKKFIEDAATIVAVPQCRQQAFGYFDTASLWMEKGIALLPPDAFKVVMPTPQQDVAPEAPTSAPVASEAQAAPAVVETQTVEPDAA